MRCEQLMKRNPECLREQDTVRQAARRMRDEGIGFLPVCDDRDRPVGVITDRDLAIRVLAEDLGGETRVAECMSREVVSCRETDELSRAEQSMAQRRKSRIMVVDEQEHLIGVISLSDLAQADRDGAAQTLQAVSKREARA